MNAFTFVESAFCLRWGEAIMHFLWQGLAITALARVAGWSLQDLPARIRYLAYLITLLMMAACLPITFLVLEYIELVPPGIGPEPPSAYASETMLSATPSDSETSPAAHPTMVAVPSPAAEADTEATAAATLPARHVAGWITTIYLAGVGLMLGRLGLGLRGGQRLRQTAEPVRNPTLLAIVHHQSVLLGLRTQPLLASCKRVSIPVVVGLFRPAILVPTSLLSGLSTDQLEIIITHELAHLRRWDHIVIVVQRIIEAVLFFHPAVWYISRLLSEERERCCDDIVVEAGMQPTGVADALLSVAEWAREERVGLRLSACPALAGHRRRAAEVIGRVQRLLGMEETFDLRLMPSWPIELVTAVLLIIAMPLWVVSQPNPAPDRGAAIHAAEMGPSPNPADWRRAVDAAAYDTAAAHDPHFHDRILWPGDVSVTDYYHQKWPRAKMMTWRITDRSAAREADPHDPANWLVDGEPAPYLPDESTDIVFPPGDYVVGGYKYKGAGWTARHVTIGSGVTCGVEIAPTGNVWIKKDALVSQFSRFSGPGNTFIRNDNMDFSNRKSRLANKIVFAKNKNTSVEIIGMLSSWDELSLFAGTLTVGPGARLVPGDRSIQCVFPDARLVLMSGANFHKRSNQTWNVDMVIAGELLAGTPTRPLTQDCTLGLSFKPKGNKDLVPPHTKKGNPRDIGLVLRPEGTLRVHSCDPEKARLVITWCGLKIKDNEPADLSALNLDQLRKRPEKIDIVLQGDARLDGVKFDWIRKGGIMLKDPALRHQWTLAFGRHNEAEPDELFATFEEKPLDDRLKVGIGRNELKSWLMNQGLETAAEHLNK